jgi:4-hydroxy-3-methylbut-2-enyl diphosphate reductase IspH
VVITGKKTHPEVLGLVSYADKAMVVENDTDLNRLIRRCREEKSWPGEGYSTVFVTSQTTGNREFYLKTLSALSEECGSLVSVEHFDSICPITEQKEHEALDIQNDVDVTVVIGDPLSSNANKLFTILQDASPRTYFVQDLEQLKEMNLPLDDFTTAQVVSSASTPKFVEDEIIRYLEEYV